jgi:hypothetical protein
MRVSAIGVLLLIVSAGIAQDKPPPPGPSPALWLASAAEQDGKVLVQIARPGLPPPPVDQNEKPAEGLLWVNLRKVTLGEKVQAFGVDGERVGPKAVLKALAERKGVAVFIRSYPDDPQTPPAFYRSLLREGTILLVVNAEDLYNPKP